MPHRAPISPTAPLPDKGLQPIIRLWLLRMLLSLGGYKKWLQPDSFSCDQLAQTLGLGHWLDENERAFDPQAVRLELRQLHQQAERDAACTRVPDCLRDNTARLAALVGLSAVENTALSTWTGTTNVANLAGTINLGDPAVDGTYRLRVGGNALIVERRESGLWVEKGRFQ